MVARYIVDMMITDGPRLGYFVWETKKSSSIAIIWYSGNRPSLGSYAPTSSVVTGLHQQLFQSC